MLVEHIAVAKAFGRISDYTINPSQEMVAIGMTNILGPFLGAFASTGSFSRTTVNSKAGVRSPIGSLISGLIVLIATYCLTSVFFYIPYTVLSAVIMHALGDLITSPNTLYQFWRVSPLEVIIFFLGVLVSVFEGIEEGVYATVGLSAVILMYRILKARGSFLGKVRVHSVLGDQVIGEDSPRPIGEYKSSRTQRAPPGASFSPSTTAMDPTRASHWRARIPASSSTDSQTDSTTPTRTTRWITSPNSFSQTLAARARSSLNERAIAHGTGPRHRSHTEETSFQR